MTNMNSKLLTICIAASLGTLTPTAFVAAQEAAGDESMIDEVLVTGSRIKRADIDGVGKVNILSADDFAKIGAVSIDQVLKYSPFTAGAQAGAESN